MGAISLGTIFGEVRLQLENLQADADAAKALFSDLTASLRQLAADAQVAAPIDEQLAAVDDAAQMTGASLDDLAASGAVSMDDLATAAEDNAALFSTAMEDATSIGSDGFVGFASTVADSLGQATQHFAEMRDSAITSFHAVSEAEDETAAHSEELGHATEALGRGFEFSLGHATEFAAGMLEFAAFAETAHAVSEFAGSLIGMNSNFEMLHAQLKAITGSGGEADRIMTWVKQFGQQIPDTTAHLAEAVVTVQSLGISATDVMPSIANVAAVMGVDLPTASRAFADAFEGRWMMMQMRLHVTKDELVKFGLNLKDIKGTLPTAFEALQAAKFPTGLTDTMTTFKGQLSNLTDRIQFFAMAMGKPLFDQAKQGLGALFKFLDSHKADVDAIAKSAGEGLAKAFHFVGEAAMLAARVLGPLFSFIGFVVPVVWQAAMAFGQALGPAIEVAARLIERIADRFKGLGEGIHSSNVSGLIHEVVTWAGRLGQLFSGALVQAMDIGYTLFTDLAQVAKELWPHLQALGQAFMDMAPHLGLAGGLFSAVTHGAHGFSDVLRGLQGVTDAVGPYIDQFVSLLGDLATTLVDNLTQAMRTVTPLLANVGHMVQTSILPAIKSLMPHVIEFAKIFAHSVVPAAMQVVQAGLKVGVAIGQVLVPILSRLIPIVAMVAGWLLKGLGGVLKNVMPYVGQAAAAVGKFATELSTRLQPIIKIVFDVIQVGLKIIQTVWNLVWPQLSTALQVTWGVIRGVIQAAWAIVSGIIKVGLDLLGGNWKRAWEDIKGIFVGVWNGIKTALMAVWRGIVHTVLSGAEKVLSVIAHLPGPLGSGARKMMKELKAMDKSVQQSTDEMASNADKNAKATEKTVTEHTASMASKTKATHASLATFVASIHADLTAKVITSAAQRKVAAIQHAVAQEAAVVAAAERQRRQLIDKIKHTTNPIEKLMLEMKLKSVTHMEQMAKASEAHLQKLAHAAQVQSRIAKYHLAQNAAQAHAIVVAHHAAMGAGVTGILAQMLAKVKAHAAATHEALTSHAHHARTEVTEHFLQMKMHSVQHVEDMHKAALAKLDKMRQGILEQMKHTSNPAEKVMLAMKLKVVDEHKQMEERSIAAAERAKVGLSKHFHETATKGHEQAKLLRHGVQQETNQLPHDMHTAGVNMVQGLADGIGAMAHAPSAALATMGQDMLNTLRNLFQIHSPSQVMASLGANISQGLVVGMQSVDVAGALGDQVSGALGSLGDGSGLDGLGDLGSGSNLGDLGAGADLGGGVGGGSTINVYVTVTPENNDTEGSPQTVGQTFGQSLGSALNATLAQNGYATMG